MGQYYMPALISESGEVKTLYSHDFDNGLKLTEHSYIGNKFVNAVLTQIAEPKRVAWIGDYSGSPYEGLYSEALPQDEFMSYYEQAWGEDRNSRIPRSAFDDVRLRSILNSSSTGKYLVNHTKHQYIDLGKWIAQNSYDDGWCINPLPLLTACGNGRGGGDYCAEYPDYDKVGLWAFDVIQFTGQLPGCFEEVMFGFKET